MKKYRTTITTGPATHELVGRIKKKLTLETASERSDADILESAAAKGLPLLAKQVLGKDVAVVHLRS